MEEHQPLGAAGEEESWLPAGAGHDEEPTWAVMVDCVPGRRQAENCLLVLDLSRGEKVERLKAESGDHGRTCSRKLVEFRLWICELCIRWPEVTGGELEMSASSRVVAVEVSGADETS